MDMTTIDLIFSPIEKVNRVVNTPANSLFSVQVTMRALVESDPNTVKDVNNAYQGLLVCRIKPHFDVGKPERINITGFAIEEKRGIVRILTSTQGIKAILPSAQVLKKLIQSSSVCMRRSGININNPKTVVPIVMLSCCM